MARFEIETLLAVEELESGNVLAYPVVDARQASIGTEADALSEQRLFLAEHLARAAPALVARYSIQEHQLHWTTVELPREDLPRALKKQPPVSIAVIVLTHGDARWALVPALQHTVYVGKDDDLAEIVQRELQRDVNARELSPWERLALFGDKQVRLEKLSVSVERPGIVDGSTAELQKKMKRAQAENHALEILGSVATPLHFDPRVTKGPLTVGRDKELSDLDALLGGPERRAVLLVGPERVGKTAVLHEWIRRDSTRRVFATSGARLIAGMSGLGQWQARMARVIEAAETLDAVLYFDDLRDLFDSRGQSSVDLAGALKPAIDEGRIRVVAELTPESADELGGHHEGFFGLLHQLRVEACSREQAMEVLAGRAEHAAKREPDSPVVDESARETICALAERYLRYRPFPGKAARLFDQLRAAALDAGLRDKPLRADDVYSLFSTQTGIPDFLLREERPLRAAAVRQVFEAQIIGQRTAVSIVVDALCLMKAALQPVDKPLGTFLFVGPTGVGKTELARTLARFLYGSEQRLVRFDMSEFAGPDAADRLIRGADGRDGLLTRSIRDQPFAVVLLDEIEKANPAIFDLLLQVAGEGRLTDARGRTAFFHNAILIMTSNLGATKSAPIGIEARRDDLGSYERAVRETFRPEMINRLDAVVPFGMLTRDEIRAVTEIAIRRIARRRGLADANATLNVSDKATDQLAADGYSPAYGARALRRHCEEALGIPIAETLAELATRRRGAALRIRHHDERPAGAEVLSRISKGDLVVEALPPTDEQSEDDLQTLRRAMSIRREVGVHLRLPSVEGQRERMAFLVAQMATAFSPKEKKKKRGTSPVDISALQSEHHRLSQTWNTLATIRDELYAVEELALGALVESQEPVSLEEELDSLRTRWRAGLLELLLSQDPRNEITVVCEEYDEGRTLNHWLSWLLRDLERRNWEATMHVFKDPTPHGPDWPADRIYGPPRDRDWMLARLDMPERDRMAVLLRVRGKHAGTLVSVECGLHRWLGVEPKPTAAHLRVRRMKLGFSLDDADWQKGALQPLQPPPEQKARLLPVVRWTDHRQDRKPSPTEIDVPLSGYWSAVCSDELALRDLLNIERRGGDRSHLLVGELDPPRNEEGDH